MTNIWNLQIFGLLFLPVAAPAVESFRWEDLPADAAKAVKADKNVQFVIVAKTGEQYKSSSGAFSVNAFGIGVGPQYLRREQVAKVAVRHRGRVNYFGSVLDKCSGEDYGCLGPFLLPLMLMDLAARGGSAVSRKAGTPLDVPASSTCENSGLFGPGHPRVSPFFAAVEF